MRFRNDAFTIMNVRSIAFLFILLTIYSSCEKIRYKEQIDDEAYISGVFKSDLIKAAGELYDKATDSFQSGVFSLVIANDSLNKFQDIICRFNAKYTTKDDSLYPYIQVYYNNPPLTKDCFRVRYKLGEAEQYRYGECKCITNGKTLAFSDPEWNGNYIITITIPIGVTLNVESFYAEYDNSFINKDSYRLMQHGRIFNSPMDCETNWQGWDHVGNYGAIVVPKRTIDGVWVCFHDDVFGDSPRVRVIGESHSLLPAESIQACTYAQTQTLEYVSTNSFDFHDRIPKLETFLEYCAKTGVHPVFSIHPNWDIDQWEELRDLVAKYNMLDKLNIKGGYSQKFIDTIYRVFGSSIESFLIDLALEKQPTNKQINALAEKPWDLARISVGFEYMSNAGGYFNDERLSMIRQNGLVHGLYYHASDVFPLNSEFIKNCIRKGCYEVSVDYFFSNGLNW